MSRILLWILGILGAIILSPIILLLLILLIIPIRYRVKFTKQDAARAHVRVSYLFGLVRYIYRYEHGAGVGQLYILFFRAGGRKARDKKQPAQAEEKPQAPTPPADTPPEKPPAPEAPKPKVSLWQKIKQAKEALTDGRIKFIIKHAFAALRKFFRVLLPRKLCVRGVFGFSCPATTAFAQGTFEIIAAFTRLRRRRRIQIDLAGDYLAEEATFRGEVFASGSVSVMRLAMPFLWLLTKKEVRNLIKDFLKGS
jgi:hypothetical protein